MKDTYTGIFISDIHWGCIDPEDMWKQLKTQLLDYIEGLKELDFLIIAGDYFDTKISLNSNTSRYSVRFIKKLLKLVKPLNTKVRIIRGTKSHDERQLEILSVFENDYDFKIFNTVEIEYLFPNFKVLYIPEEYMKDKDEHYSKYMEDRYNLVVGHGMFKEVGLIAHAQLGEETNPRAPIFNSSEIIDICKGPIFFGHIHIPQVIKEKIFYIGSFVRSSFGEPEDKGFFHSTISIDGTFENKFIVNDISQRFDTIDIKVGTETMSNIDSINILLELYRTYFVVNREGYDKLRLKIQIDDNDTLIQMIRETFVSLADVKLEILNNKKIERDEKLEKTINSLKERYGFLFTKNLEPEEMISRFIKIQYEEEIGKDDVLKYL